MFSSEVRNFKLTCGLCRDLCRQECQDAIFIRRELVDRYLQPQYQASHRPRRRIHRMGRRKSRIGSHDALSVLGARRCRIQGSPHRSRLRQCGADRGYRCEGDPYRRTNHLRSDLEIPLEGRRCFQLPRTHRYQANGEVSSL